MYIKVALTFQQLYLQCLLDQRDLKQLMNQKEFVYVQHHLLDSMECSVI